jgi:cytochrome c556
VFTAAGSTALHNPLNGEETDMNSIRIAIALTALGAFLLLPLHSASAQSDEAYIKYRQKVMGSLGQNMGAIGDIMKEGLPYKENIAHHAAAINEAAKSIAAAFKKEVTAGPTDAKGDIWKEYKEFGEKAEKLQAESAKLMKVSMSGDMSALGAQVKELGGACGGCHKEYRKPKEESYKNKM